MIISAIVSLAAHPFIVARYSKDDPRIVAVTMLVTVVVSTIVWLAVTYMTAPEPDETLDAFYLRVRPGGPGWARVSERLGFGRESTPGGALAWTNWIAGIVAVYSTLFGIGKLVFGELGNGLILLAIALVAFIWIARSFRNEVPPPAMQAGEAVSMAAD
jgi:Na+/proline symporter